MMASDPDLSEAGRARAAALASMLRSAGVTSIFTTEFKRTQQTAAPLAAALGVQPTVVGSRDTARLLEMVRKAGGTVLVVGHSNTVPEIVKALGVATPVTVADDEFDNLFVVVAGARPTLVRLRYR
jgi:broad specificity phosphatase PhoE